jgi:hypothetical protein
VGLNTLEFLSIECHQLPSGVDGVWLPRGYALGLHNQGKSSNDPDAQQNAKCSLHSQSLPIKIDKTECNLLGGKAMDAQGFAGG